MSGRGQPLPQPVAGNPAAAARRRLRRLERERTALGELAFERVQLRRRAERLECVRARTRAAVAARRTLQPELEWLPFEEIA